MYVKLANGVIDVFPYGITDLMRDNPNVSFHEIIADELLAQFDVYPVTPQEIPRPFDDVTQNATIIDPVLVNGKWMQAWSITQASDVDVAQRLGDLEQNARATRASLLAETDWTGLSDNSMSPEMALYRQSLRDITSQDGFPRSIVWPEKPK